VVNVRFVGAQALLIEVDEPLAWHAELGRRRDAGELTAVDIVPGARTVLLDGVPDPAALASRLPGWRPADGPSARLDRLVEIPMTFDGPDLAAVAGHWTHAEGGVSEGGVPEGGVSEGGVVERLLGTEFRVAFCGFAPGFAYLAGLPAALAVPRLDTPRTRVPAGSVGLAGPYAGIYPTASPGGWLLVGRTEVRLFDVDARPPALLTPGTRVRFTS
jgi:KipI family sensor histidine kinase inhibitor